MKNDFWDFIMETNSTMYQYLDGYYAAGFKVSPLETQ